MPKSARRQPKPKAAAKRLTPADVSLRADELRDFADQLDRYAASMSRLDVPELNVLMGNWTVATGQIRNFIAQQIVSKLIAAAAQRGRDAHHVFEAALLAPAAEAPPSTDR